MVVEELVFVATRVPPLVLEAVLLYHSYFVMEPLPAAAVTERAVAVALAQ